MSRKPSFMTRALRELRHTADAKTRAVRHGRESPKGSPRPSQTARYDMERVLARAGRAVPDFEMRLRLQISLRVGSALLYSHLLPFYGPPSTSTSDFNFRLQLQNAEVNFGSTRMTSECRFRFRFRREGHLSLQNAECNFRFHHIAECRFGFQISNEVG